MPIEYKEDILMDMTGRIYTREDIVRILDAKIEMEAKKWGTNYIYTRWAREDKDNKLAKYDMGEVILVESEWYYEDGMNFEIEYYSDSSIKRACYGYYD